MLSGGREPLYPRPSEPLYPRLSYPRPSTPRPSEFGYPEEPRAEPYEPRFSEPPPIEDDRPVCSAEERGAMGVNFCQPPLLAAPPSRPASEPVLPGLDAEPILELLRVSVFERAAFSPDWLNPRDPVSPVRALFPFPMFRLWMGLGLDRLVPDWTL